MKRRVLSCLCAATMLTAVVGCANPADGKPEAVVSEPAPETEQAAAGAIYKLDADSTVGFVGSKVTGSHEGGFNSFDGEIHLAGNDATAGSVHVVIDTTSLWADHPKLTEHLKSPDFFDVASHPTAEFTSTAIVAEGEGFMITGNLDLHGVEKSISFPASIEVTESGVATSAEFSVMRFDFGIEFKGKADDLIRDEVVIKLDLTASPAG